MVDRIDLLIAVVGIVAAIVGSSAPLWMTLSKKADKEDLRRLEDRIGARFDAFETKFDTKLDGLETRTVASLTRVEGKLDAIILRLVPDQFPPPGELGAGRG